MAKLTAPRRVANQPVLHHLNGDTSWLLQIPRTDKQDAKGRLYFNILIDPWFTGWQRELASWFHDQAHKVPSAVETIAELEDFLATTEETDHDVPSLLDAVVVTLHASDHSNPETLLQVHPSVPIYALPQTVSGIKGLKHFKNINQIPLWTSGNDWLANSVSVIAGHVRVSGLRQPHDMTYLHYGIVLTLGDRPNDSHHYAQGDAVDAILYAPHGIRSRNLEHLATSNPPLRFIALMQAFHNVKVGVKTIGWQDDVVHGARSALETARLLGAECVVSTHDELKHEKGATAYFLSREILHIDDALNEEKNSTRNPAERNGLQRVEGIVLDSGEHTLLKR